MTTIETPTYRKVSHVQKMIMRETLQSVLQKYVITYTDIHKMCSQLGEKLMDYIAVYGTCDPHIYMITYIPTIYRGWWSWLQNNPTMEDLTIFWFIRQITGALHMDIDELMTDELYFSPTTLKSYSCNKNVGIKNMSNLVSVYTIVVPHSNIHTIPSTNAEDAVFIMKYGEKEISTEITTSKGLVTTLILPVYTCISGSCEIVLHGNDGTKYLIMHLKRDSNCC